METDTRFIIQFYTAEGEPVGPQLDIQSSASSEVLQDLLNSIQETSDSFLFYLHNIEVKDTLDKAVQEASHSSELVVPLTFHPESPFSVAPATRATSCLEGHTEAILCIQYSPDGSSLASGGGDACVRIWDVQTETPYKTLKGHNNWVLVLSWSPDMSSLASAGVDGTIRLWDPESGEQQGKSIQAHRKWVTSLSWEPLHHSGSSNRLASSSKDHTIKIFEKSSKSLISSLSGHNAAVTKVIWGSYLYSASQDRTVRVWSSSTFSVVRELKGHGHWVNHLTCSTDFALRTGCFDPKEPQSLNGLSSEERKTKAEKIYMKILGKGERLASCSDDFTLFLWSPGSSEKHVARMTGHQQLITQVLFSPDGHFLASASNDKSVKLWEGFTGAYLTSFRGHVANVYQISWAPDSRMIASASKDSTVKIWNVKKKKMQVDLPGHADQVFAIDWSPDGLKMASGGRDRILNIWRN
jgi:ribosome assembly protein 4